MSAGERAVELAAAVEAAGGALPLPAGPEPRTLDVVEEELTGANLSLFEEEQETARLRLALKAAKRGRSELRARVAELEAQRERRRVRLVALQNDALNMRGSLSPNGEDRKVPFPLGETLTPAVDWLIARVAELEAERDRWRQLPDLPVDKLAKALLLIETGPALPWAHAMDDGDLHDFLGDLVSAALNRWRSDPEVPDRETLADIEKVCADWRTPGQGLRSDEPEMFVPRTERSYWVAIADALNAAHSAGMPVGIDLDGTLTDRNAWSVVWDRSAERWAVAGYEDGFPPLDEASKASFAERAARETDSGRRAAWRMLAEPQPEFHAYLHHPYTKGHDRPETGRNQ